MLYYNININKFLYENIGNSILMPYSCNTTIMKGEFGMDKKEIWKHAGTKLRELRKSTGKSIFKVGREIGVSGSYISQVERGSCAASDAVLVAMANLYGVDKKELFDLYIRIENEEANRLVANPALRKVFTQVSADKKLSQDEKDEIVKELQRIADKYLNDKETDDV